MNRRTFIETAGIGAFGLLSSDLYGWENVAEIFSAPKLTRKSPESQGILSKGIRDFLNATRESGLEWHSFMLLRHGHVVAEAWWKPFEAGFKHTLYSLSKSFTSTAIGLLVKEGKIKVDDPVLSFFPEERPSNPGENLRAMKIKHLLTMNTGHDTDTTSPMRASTQSWAKAFLEQEVKHAPGSHFLYNTGATYMLGAIVHKVTGLILEDYLAPRLFRPLGIKGYDWEKSPQGLNTAGYGLRVKTEDIARFGQLYLQKGKWNGKQIITEAWIDEATSKQTSSNTGDSDWSQGYGYQFWRCKPGFYRGDGAFGQFCMVMPEQDAVLAMTCESWDLQKTMNVAYQTLLPAMKNEMLAENPAELKALKMELASLSLPVPKGQTQSPLAARYHDRDFVFEKNAYGVVETGFLFSPEACTWELSTAGTESKIKFGWENWHLNKGVPQNLFPVAGRTHMPSKVAGTATWLNENTLQLNLKFVEAIHGDKITCVFEGDKVGISFLNSISENTKNNPDGRASLIGRLKKE